jgi:hypothetical protein
LRGRHRSSLYVGRFRARRGVLVRYRFIRYLGFRLGRRLGLGYAFWLSDRLGLGLRGHLRLGLGLRSSPRSNMTSLGMPRMVVVHGPIRVRRSRGIATSRDRTTTGRRPASAS